MNLIEKYAKQPSDIYQHLTTLYILTVEFNLKTILELGIREGKSTIALLKAAYQIGGEVYSVDINSCLEARNVIEKHRLNDRWVFIPGDDLKVEWNKPLDYLFIDTSHEYKQTIKELEKYEPCVKIGVIITLHDITACQRL
jgi:predicted O-methyltransferase YrrM